MVRHASTPAAPTSDSKILSFETMYGVDDGFVKNKAIRGVEGDELPWAVGSAVGSLTVGGHLTVSVRGIVFTNDPAGARSVFAVLPRSVSQSTRRSKASDHDGIVTLPPAVYSAPA